MGSPRRQKPDRVFLAIAGILFIAGLFILASASLPLSQREFGHPFYYLVRQLTLGGAIGLVAGVLVQFLPIGFFRRAAVPLFFGTVVLLGIVLIPSVGLDSGGATRWIQAGPITIQPSEIAKVTLPLYLAAWFTARQSKRSREGPSRGSVEGGTLASFFGILVLVGIPLLLQPDLSSFGVLAITALLLLFLSGASRKSVVYVIAAGVGALVLLIRIAPYRMQRILAFTDPHSDPLGIGYQVNQALLAVGSGGLFGRGFGFSREKLFYLPEPMGDSIFAVFAEEAGFIGATLLVVLFVLFLWRGFYIVRRLPDPFLQLFAAGLVGWIIVQAFLNIGGNVALLPLVGITLPFVSYGSASLAVTILSVGILYKLSRYARAN